MPFPLPDRLHQASGLVVDASSHSRSLLVSQLRDLGLKTVAQAHRISDARRLLEQSAYDIVVCEQHFPNDKSTGQQLLDDLRRCGLLPFATDFIMVTAEASYTKVAEAAESALDAYLVKPHTSARLEERIVQARRRKAVLRDIFTAIENQEWQRAASLCMERFQSKEEYWLYAGRVGAELMLREQAFEQAQKLFENMCAINDQPWARLGIARAQLEAGLVKPAAQTLDALLQTYPTYTETHDTMGRVKTELGQFEAALEAYKTAMAMTPASIGRLQRYGMLAHYCGDPVLAEQALAQSVQLGRDSKMFDAQALVLLAAMRCANNNRKELQHCLADIEAYTQRYPDSVRLQRLHTAVVALVHIQDHESQQAVDTLQTLLSSIQDDTFDFEAACNLLMVLGQMVSKGIRVPTLDPVVTQVGERFCTSKALTELLVRSARESEVHVHLLQEAYAQTVKYLELAVKRSLNGEADSAVRLLLQLGEKTQNTKVIETAWALLKRHESRVPDAAALAAPLQALRMRYNSFANRVAIGDKNLRQAGGVSLRVMDLKAG